MRPISHVLTALVAVSLLAGCNKEKAPATSKAQAPASGASAEPSPDTVVASFGDGQKVTLKDLNERLQDQLDNLEKQKHQIRKQGLDGLIVERLVQAEAKKRGMSEEEFIKAEVDGKVPQPPEEEIKKLFDEAKGRLPPGATLDQMRPQIVEFLTGSKKRERANELFAQLKKDANVQITLPEPPRPPPVRKEVAATGPSRGPENAPITIVEFSDFQCPFCTRASKTVDEVVKEYGDKVRLVFRHFPLDFHKEAPKASEASMCAHEQGKFWEYHDLLFANQQALQVDKLKGYAQQLKLDTAKFNECLDSGKHAATVSGDMEAGKKAGVSGTPAFFINGILLSGAQPIDEFKSVIDAELKEKK